MIPLTEEKINQGNVGCRSGHCLHDNNMPRALTTAICHAILADKADLKTKVTMKTTWADISALKPAGFATPMDYVTRCDMKDAKFGDVIKRIIRDMCKKAYELKVIKHRSIGISKKDKVDEDMLSFVTRLLSIMMHLYKKHNTDDEFMNNLAQVPMEDANDPGTSGWNRIIKTYKTEVDDKVAQLKAKNDRAAEERERMDKFVNKVQMLSLQKEDSV